MNETLYYAVVGSLGTYVVMETLKFLLFNVRLSVSFQSGSLRIGLGHRRAEHPAADGGYRIRKVRMRDEEEPDKEEAKASKAAVVAKWKDKMAGDYAAGNNEHGPGWYARQAADELSGKAAEDMEG